MEQKNHNQVRVDYKYTNSQSSLISTTRAPSPAKGQTETGNGRIRKCLALGCAAVVGTTVFNSVFSGSGTDDSVAIERALPTTSSTALVAHNEGISEPHALEISEESIQPQFFFQNDHNTQPLAMVDDVPFLKVDRIDDIRPEDTTGKLTVNNPTPFTAAAPESINDYSQEPSKILVEIQRGDTLSGLLSDHGLSPAEIATITALPEVKDYLVNIRPGQEIQIDLDGSRRLTSLHRDIDIAKSLSVTREPDNKFMAKVDVHPLEKKIHVAELTMNTSLFNDGAKAGLAESVIMELYSIFQWTVDFNREVRNGDVLTVLHETFHKDGKKVKDGNILAAAYQSANDTHSAFRYVNSDGETGYYDSKGQSLEKQFLRNPIKARITSRFNLKRKHPIRHTIRAHKGVDYGAPTGTPVSAAGAGKVTFAGVKGTYGNTVEIQHGDRYTTLYAHLHKFPKGLKRGQRVKQGQIIGYVGATGLATGPHLHYEFRIDGIHRDPQKVKLGGSIPLDKNEMMAFKDGIEPLRARLASVRTIATR